MIEETTEKAWQVPYSNRVDSITNFQHTEAEEDDSDSPRFSHKSAGCLSEQELNKVREYRYSRTPASPSDSSLTSGHVTAINVTVQLPRINEMVETPEVVTYVRNLADEIREAHPNVNVYLTGMMMMNNAFSESSKNDMASIVPISFGVMLLLLALLVGGFTGTFATLASHHVLDPVGDGALARTLACRSLLLRLARQQSSLPSQSQTACTYSRYLSP